MRGGVSLIKGTAELTDRSSPHARGCFYVHHLLLMRSAVFPACAGVFPELMYEASSMSRLPRMRGGVSKECADPRTYQGSSPHARGCF